MMKHIVIVPGVGGSNLQHWQSWLQVQCADSSRVQQADWNTPILSQWVQYLVAHLQQITAPIQIVAHSFGCLTTVAAIAQHPELKARIDSLLLVSPANPRRFSHHGFAADGTADDLGHYFESINLGIKSLIVYSENDPWHDVASTLNYARLWGSRTFNEGAAGHINFASGYGAWPQVIEHLYHLAQSTTASINPISADNHQYFISNATTSTANENATLNKNL